MSRKSTYQPEKFQQVLPSAFSLFGPSWRAIRRNLITVLEFVLLPFIAEGLAFLVFRSAGEPSLIDYVTVGDQAKFGSGMIAAIVASGLVTLLTGPAATLVYLRSAQKRKIDFWPALRDSAPLFGRYVGVCILFSIGVAAGLLLFVIPGLIVLQRLYLAPYFLIDQRLSITAALQRSWQTSRRYQGAVWGLIGVVMGISLIPALLNLSIVSQILAILYAAAPAVRYLQIKQAETAG